MSCHIWTVKCCSLSIYWKPHCKSNNITMWYINLMPRLEWYDYSQPWFYFVTICTTNRRPFFWWVENKVVCLSAAWKIVDDICVKFPDICNWIELDMYQIMPDHVHMIVAIYDANDPLWIVIRKFKASVTQKIRWELWLQDFAWQKNYYEHIIRGDVSLQKIRQYMLDNPLQFSIDVMNRLWNV